MDIKAFFKSVLEQDPAPVVLCDLAHTVVYMNPAAIARYKADLTGRSIKECHPPKANETIDRVVAWFAQSDQNNSVYTYRNDQEDKDVYMIALRDDEENLIGYYEKHAYRGRETQPLYEGIVL